MKARLIMFIWLATLMALHSQVISDEELAMRCSFAKKCFSERVAIAQEVESLMTIASAAQSVNIDSKVESLSARTKLYEEVCAPHMWYFLKLLQDPPGGMESLNRCCGINYVKEIGQILGELPLVGPVKK